MTRRTVTEKETCAQVVITGTMPATADNSKEESTMKKVTVKELREQAKTAGIKGYSRMKKAELEAALENQTLSEKVEEETTMKQAEYCRTEQRKIAIEVIETLRAAETSSEKKRILEEADYFTLEGIAIKLGMTLPQMPEEDGLRERLIAVFVKPESDEEDESNPVSLEKHYDAKMRKDFNDFVKRLYGNESEEKVEAQMQIVKSESDDARTKERKDARTVLSDIRSESDTRKREEMLRSITDSKDVEAIAKELYGADYVRELLIRELCQKEERVEAQTEARPVTPEEFKKAFDELEHGKIFVNIPELRKALNWSKEDFDEMLRKLRDERVIQLHVTDVTIFEPEEFFYDEVDNSRMGMLTWKAA